MLFRDKVLALVKKIPKGKFATYAQVAKKLHTSPKAVGRALSTNPSPEEIHCYRVIMSSGEIGGYKLGAKRKAELLKKDGFCIKKGKILRQTKNSHFGLNGL